MFSSPCKLWSVFIWVHGASRAAAAKNRFAKSKAADVGLLSYAGIIRIRFKGSGHGPDLSRLSPAPRRDASRRIIIAKPHASCQEMRAVIE
jgi:hypothetical protein